MSALEPDPSITKRISLGELGSKAEEEQLNEIYSPRRTSFVEGMKSQMKEWALTVLAPLLVILKVTIIFACALLADYFILIIINWSFGGIISHNSFAANILEGIQILSALGTAVAYILYLLRSLIKDTADILK